MKIKFSETLQDKNTQAYYYKGTVHEFEEERGKEILQSGRAVELYVETPKPEVKEKPQEETPELESVDLKSLNINELRACAKQFNVSAKGTKAEIIARLEAL